MGKHSGHSAGFFGRKKPKSRTARDRQGVRTIGSTPSARSPRAPKERVGEQQGRRRGPLEQAPARLKAERDRRRHNYKRIAAYSALGLLALVLAAALGGFLFLRSVEGTMQLANGEKLNLALEKAKPQEPYTVLILGGDKRKGETTYRTDTMMLARVDPREKKVWLISIPRDTRVEIPDHGASKINSAFVYNGPEGAVDAASQATGVPINHYMQVDFGGFEAAVDALGGVWIDVPVEIDDVKAASHSKNASAARIDSGYQLLDGEHALTFVRARHQFIDQDFSRMKNQQIFFKALADQVAKTQNIAKLPRVVSAIAPYIKTDMSLVEMIRTAQALMGAGSDNVSTATLEGDWRSPFIYTNEEKKAELVEKMMAGVSFEATAVPEPAKEKGTRKPSEIAVAVRNGAGIAGSAKQASSILKAQGFDVVEVGNTQQFVYDRTLVVYKDDVKSAEQVASVLPPGTKVVESRGMYSFDARVLVVIGKDWDLAKVPVAPIKTD